MHATPFGPPQCVNVGLNAFKLVSHGTLDYVPLTVQRYKFEALLDSGASVSALPLWLHQRLLKVAPPRT